MNEDFIIFPAVCDVQIILCILIADLADIILPFTVVNSNHSAAYFVKQLNKKFLVEIIRMCANSHDDLSDIYDIYDDDIYDIFFYC